jgi:hypothetical protein
MASEVYMSPNCMPHIIKEDFDLMPTPDAYKYWIFADGWSKHKMKENRTKQRLIDYAGDSLLSRTTLKTKLLSVPTYAESCKKVWKMLVLGV